MVVQLDHPGIAKPPWFVPEATASGPTVAIDGPERVPLREKIVEAAGQ